MTNTTRLQLVFVLLQLADLVTTVVAIAMGGFEANPLVSRFLVFGSLSGLIFAKVLVLAIATAAVIARRYRVIRVANVVYSGVVVWNLFIIVVTAINRP